jgi:hypothetical protein
MVTFLDDLSANFAQARDCATEIRSCREIGGKGSMTRSVMLFSRGVGARNRLRLCKKPRHFCKLSETSQKF